MLDNIIKNKRFKSSLSLIAIATMSLGYSNLINAKEVSLEDEVEVIEITGSRIKRTEMEAVTPIVSVSGDDLRKTGALNISDALNKLPIVVPDLGDTTSNHNGNAGMASQNLRGLGAERTLVLVNGRRHVPSFPGSTTVDISTIPMPLIDRVEIMTGGASAIYGADAVAGVMNIILKKQFDGTKANASYGLSGEGDGKRMAFDITHGTNIFNGTGNIVANFSYYKSDSINANDRSYVDNDIAYRPNPNDPDENIAGIADRTVQQYNRFWNQSDRNFFIDGVVYKLNADGSKSPTGMGPGGIMGDAQAGFFGAYTNGGDYYFGDYEYQLLTVPSEKYNFNVTVQQELGDNLNLFVDTKYVKGNSQQRWSPYAEYGGNNLPQDYQFYTADQKAEVERTGNGLEWAGFFPELGSGGADWNNELFQIVTSLEGELSNEYTWNVSLQHGVSKSANTSHGGIYQGKWDAGVGTWWTTCDSDCVPINVFQPLTQEMIDYVSLPKHTGRAKLKQTIVTANISGDLWELPAGFVSFASGIEHRKESSEDIPSEISQSGVGGGYSVTKPIEGKYNVTEIYTEIRIPLLQDKFLAKSLSVEGAVRYADYSTAGGNTSWNLGTEWQPIDDIKFRASYAKAARAPNINEVFATENYGGEWLVDPCNAWFVDDNENRVSNCAALGIDSDSIPYWTYTNQNFSGNPDLESEVAKTLTIGAVINPRWLEGFDITLDYWHVDLSGEINSYDMNTIVESCVDSETIDNPFCGFVTRRADGIVDLVEMTQLNLAKHSVKGLDIIANYSLDLQQYGSLSFNTIWSKMLERKLQSDKSTEEIDFVGGMAYPQWRGNLNMTYSFSNFSTTINQRFIGSQKTDLETTSEDRYPNETGNVWYTDLSVNYWYTDNINFNLAINNLFDKGTPQLPLANRGGASYHLGYTGGLFDTIGRYATLNVSYNF